MNSMNIATFILILASNFASADEEWIDVASSKSGSTILSIKSGSLEFTETKGGTTIALVVGRDSNQKTSQITLEKWYVSAIDCKNKMGKLVTLSISGEYKYENDFVFSGGSVASSIAEAICGAAEYAINASKEKSL